MRHRSIALPLAVLASFAIASVVVAGGWAQVTATNVPVDPPVGEEATIEMDVLQHGITPVSWPGLTVIATDAASGTVVRADARAVGAAGSYVATIVFPSAGDWTLTFTSTDLVMEGSVSMRVAPPVAAAPGGAGTPAADVLPLLLALLAAAVILVIGGAALQRRGGSAGARLSART
jgi:hypothetical protein